MPDFSLMLSEMSYQQGKKLPSLITLHPQMNLGASLTPVPKLQITEIFYTWHSLSFCDFSPPNTHFSSITTHSTANLAASICCPCFLPAADPALSDHGQTHTSLCVT